MNKINIRREQNFLKVFKDQGAIRLDLTTKKLEYRGQASTNFYKLLILSNGFRKVSNYW